MNCILAQTNTSTSKVKGRKTRGGLSIGEIQCSDFMKRYSKFGSIALILIIAVVLLGCSIDKEKALVLTDLEEGLERRMAVPDRMFTLSFIHSVHHTPVHEVIHIQDDNSLVLKEVRYRSLGVGMPYDYENGTLENIDGEFVLKFEREFDIINMTVSPIPEHSITIGQEDYPLLEFTKPESPLEIKAVDEWSLKWPRLGKKGA